MNKSIQDSINHTINEAIEQEAIGFDSYHDDLLTSDEESSLDDALSNIPNPEVVAHPVNKVVAHPVNKVVAHPVKTSSSSSSTIVYPKMVTISSHTSCSSQSSNPSGTSMSSPSSAKIVTKSSSISSSCSAPIANLNIVTKSSSTSSSSSSSPPMKDPKMWTLDDVHCSSDFSTVLTINGRNPKDKNAGPTVSKLRTFCSSLPKDYSNANKEVILQMLLNRKKGKDAAVQFRNEVDNTTSTPVPISQRSGKKPSALTEQGISLRFVNTFFHQQMREHTGQLKNGMNIQDLDKRKTIPHSNVWEAIAKFYGEYLYPNEELDAITITMGKINVYWSFKVEASSPADFDKMDTEDLYLLHAFLMKRYNIVHRNFKKSGSHGHFDNFIRRDWLVSPAIYYFYLRLTECGNDTHKSQATNTLPDA